MGAGVILLSMLDLLCKKVMICYAAEISPAAKYPRFNTMNRAVVVNMTSATYILPIGRQFCSQKGSLKSSKFADLQFLIACVELDYHGVIVLAYVY